jgi:hypothetical protein
MVAQANLHAYFALVLSGRRRQCNAQNFIELQAKIKTQQPLFVSVLLR